MPNPHAHRIPSPKLLSPLGRALAALQVAKETLTIGLLGVPLLLGRPLLVPAVLPGLVLYLFRWVLVLVLGRVRRRGAAAVWLLTLLDEAWGLALYHRAADAPTVRQLHYLNWSYWLGLALTVAALLEIAYHRRRERASLRALLRSA